MEKKQKVGVQGQVIHAQGREIIANVISFMEKEARGEIIIPMENVKQRALLATGISRSTYYKIKNEKRKIDEGSSSSFTTPGEKRFKESTKLNVYELHGCAIRRLLYNYYIVERKTPTIKLLLEAIIEAGIEFSGKDTTLRMVLHKLGFRWKKTIDNKKVLCEKYEIRSQRINYLREIAKYRADNRPIVYTDETYIINSHVMKSSENSISGVRTPIKGRLIIVHACGENGFIPNALLIFKSGSQTPDNDEMNQEDFSKWLQEKLIPNLPPKSVVVIDNASYRNVKTVKCPNLEWKKTDMINWLKERSIKFPINATKPELYDLIKYYEPSNTSNKIDELLTLHGHDVLKLPPYHPELNPMKKVWVLVKKWIGANNVIFDLFNVQKLTEKKLEKISGAEWQGVCESVKQTEREYIEKEHITDEYIDSVIINVSDSESEGFQSNNDE